MLYLFAFFGLLGGTIILLKLYVKSIIKKYNGKEMLDGKTAIVTGANSGVGYFCAKDFAKRGARLIMVCRDMKKAEKAMTHIIKETGNTNIKLKYVDFTSLTSVRKCAVEILKEEPKIDILLNNAGAGDIGLKKTEDGLDILMQINYFAHFLFTNILLERIKKSAPSRIVNVSSLLHHLGHIDLNNIKNPNPRFLITLYGISKLALVHFSNELARKLKGSGVTVNSLHPGTFSSEITRSSNLIIQFLWNKVGGLFFRTTEEASYTPIYCCVSKEIDGITGAFFDECKFANPSYKSKDIEISKKLWQLTEEAVKLRSTEKHY